MRKTAFVTIFAIVALVVAAAIAVGGSKSGTSPKPQAEAPTTAQK
jgi:hypothetical protein